MAIPISANDRKLYFEMVRLLHSLVYTLTTKFLQDDKSRDDIVHQLKLVAAAMTDRYGCGDLCPDKEKTCVPCVY